MTQARLPSRLLQSAAPAEGWRANRCCAALAVCVLLAVCSVPGRVFAERLVIAVGSSEGLRNEWPLSFAVHDAEQFASVMTELGDVAPDDAHVLRDPSASDVVSTLRALGQHASASATVLVYYSGHGSASALHLRGERLDLGALRAELTNMRGDLRLLVVDACRDALTRKGFSATKPFEISLAGSDEHKGLIVMQAAGAGEVALESDQFKAGVFSHYLISALRGAADRDADGRITLYEAYDYAYSGTLRTSSGSSDRLQHPVLKLDVAGAGPLVLTRLAFKGSGLTLPAARDELYVIFQKGSHAALAEVWTRSDRKTRVALPSGQFVVYRRTPFGRAATEVTLPFGGTWQLSETDFVPSSASEFARKGGEYALHEHRVGVVAGASIDDSRHAGPALRADYHRAASGWSPNLGLGWSMQLFRTAANDVQRQAFDVSAGVDYRMPLNRFNAAWGAGLRATWFTQRLSDRTARARDTDAALGLGGFVRMRFDIPLSLRVAWQLDSMLVLNLFRQDWLAASPGRSLTAEFSFVLASGPVISF